MLVLVSYDVSTVSKEGKRRLRLVAKICENHGIRVQNSVFECNVDSAQWVKVKAELLATYNPEEDSLRFYNLGKNYTPKIEHFGTKVAVDVEDVLII